MADVAQLPLPGSVDCAVRVTRAGIHPIPPMKRVLFWLLVVVCVAKGFCGPSVLRAQDRLLPPPDGGPVRAGVSLKVDPGDGTAVKAVAHVQFRGYYLVTGQSPVTRDEKGRFLLDATVESAAVIMIHPPPPYPVVDLAYDLGALEEGRYEAIFRMNGIEFARKSFAVGDGEDPEPPRPDPVRVSLAYVDAQPGADGSWVAEVGVIARPDVAARLEWLPLESGDATFTAPLRLHDKPLPPGTEDEVEPAGDVIFQADSSGYSRTADGGSHELRHLVRHTYSLGSPEPGTYRFRVVLDGAEVGSRRIRIPDAGPVDPPARLAALEITAERDGTVEATARLLLTNPRHTVLDWGTPALEDSRFVVDITVGEADDGAEKQPLLPKDPPLRLHSHTWNLGTLAPGDYEFAVLANGTLIGSRAFPVKPSPPLPPGTRLAFIHVRHGDVTTAAEVGILPARGRTVTDWGEVTRDEENPDHFHVTIRTGPDGDPAGDLRAPSRIERHSYSLGELSPGRYSFTVYHESPGEALGTRRFHVAPKPPQPPAPPPIVTHIGISAGETAVPLWVADVELLLLRSGQTVRDWGEVARDGNTLTVDIVTGPSDPGESPPDSEEPDAGGKPEAGDLRTDDELGGWPVRRFRHQYELGALEGGKYRFAVRVDGRTAATKPFAVPESGGPGPEADLQSEAVTAAGTSPHPFSIVFTSPAGWPESPSAATVTISGPDGYSAPARLVSVIPSMDPAGRTEVVHYEADPPGGSWGPEDNGRYTVTVDPAGVVDGGGRTLADPVAGSFAVRIPPLPQPGIRADVVTSMTDGIWHAEVSFPNSGGWTDVDWGDVRLRGPVFSVRARLMAGDTGEPPPEEFRHTYRIGPLTPGHYLFLFTSDAGHAGAGEISVPGVPPPSQLLSWLENAGRGSALPPDDDSDNDRWPCFAEYYTGGDPHRPDQPAVEPALVHRDGRTFAGLRFRRIAGGDPSVRCRVEAAADFRHWSDAGSDVEWLIDPPDADGTQQVTVVRKTSVGTAGDKPFLRLVLEAAPPD